MSNTMPVICRILFGFAFWFGPLQAEVLISPVEAMQQAFGTASDVTKKNKLLTAKEAASVSRAAQMKLETRIYRIFTAAKEGTVLGYGVLVARKVRSKDAAVLYLIRPDGTIKGIEIIAFNEPPEFIPQPQYLTQFEGKSSTDTLRVGKDIPTVSGATLSARNVTDGARLALAVFETLIGENR